MASKLGQIPCRHPVALLNNFIRQPKHSYLQDLLLTGYHLLERSLRMWLSWSEHVMCSRQSLPAAVVIPTPMSTLGCVTHAHTWSTTTVSARLSVHSLGVTGRDYVTIACSHSTVMFRVVAVLLTAVKKITLRIVWQLMPTRPTSIHPTLQKLKSS
jgi:hypothetical protein